MPLLEKTPGYVTENKALYITRGKGDCQEEKEEDEGEYEGGKGHSKKVKAK